jgi:hypothetical protein
MLNGSLLRKDFFSSYKLFRWFSLSAGLIEIEDLCGFSSVYGLWVDPLVPLIMALTYRLTFSSISFMKSMSFLA